MVPFFTTLQINDWEASDCVNFAVGLSRLTGWLLHVDWWTTTTESIEDNSPNQLKPLRVYVGDNCDHIFDVRGIMSIIDFNQNLISELIVSKFGPGEGGVCTFFYGEDKLSSLPLRKQPDETLVGRAIIEIKANPHFLDAIPVRNPPYIPAHIAAEFTFGKCSVFAEAMWELTGLQPVALLAECFSPPFEGTRRSESGYFHSVVIHPDGMAEDAWGKASLKDIASRFGVIDFKISDNEHRTVIDNLKRNSSDLYKTKLKDAINLIKVHRRTS